MSALRALFLGVTAALAMPAAAGSPPTDCLGDPSPAAVITAIFAADSECDPNGDQVSSAADLPKTVELLTLPPCPVGGASLGIIIDNESGEDTVAVEMRGELVEPSCRSEALGASYSRPMDCAIDGPELCGVVEGLVPGVWKHRFSSRGGSGLQLQYRQTLLTVDPVPDTVRFTHFASSLTVTNPGNSGDGSLRQALQSAASLPKPLLIRFHDLLFPAGVPTIIPLAFPLTTLATDDVTIDGTDELGEVGNRIIDAQGLPFGVLSITGARNHIIGLGLRNAGGANRDVVQISGEKAQGNFVERCVISDSASGDGVSVDDGAGVDFGATANVVRNCEIRGAGDKGVKVTTGAHARIESSWIHDNRNGGVQSTLGGNVETLENVIEDNFGGTAQNGLAVQGFDVLVGAARLASRGDVVRRNGANGAIVRGFALGQIRDGYLADNGSSGLRVFNDLGAPALGSAEGTTFACNGVDGAVVADGSWLDLGSGGLGSRGDNALTQNDLPGGGANLRTATDKIVYAINNQWEHCGTGTSCNDEAIAARDLSDHGVGTVFAPAQANRGLLPPVVTAVAPQKGSAGELLRIYGSNFNAIDGHFSELACDDVVGRNRCVPLRGNCVRIGGLPAPVEAVTPTMLVVRWPLTCLAPVPLVVTVDHGSVGTTSAPFDVCKSGADVLPGD